MSELDQMLDRVDEVIQKAPWRGSKLKGVHEYIMQPKYPELYDVLHPIIAEHGYNAMYGDYEYRYWNHDGYRYWIFDSWVWKYGYPSGDAAINRAKEDAPRL